MSEQPDNRLLEAFTEFKRVTEENALKASTDPRNLPGHPAYGYWCLDYMLRRDIWEISEAISLFMGCLPFRPLTVSYQDDLNRKANHLLSTMKACQGESLTILNPEDPPKKWRVRAIDVLNWAVEKCLDLPDEISNYLKPANPESQRDQTGGYSTPLMEAVFTVVEQFWSTYDPDEPATAPKQAEILEWLLANLDLSKTQARAVDQIARAPERRKGGQTKIIDTRQ